MINLPSGLTNFMKGQDLKGLKPFALLYRNKWDSTNNVYALESTPVDISALIVKPNTLSMTLDVNEIAQYNANNVTLTLSDTKNYFVEGTPNSYFPEGYQLYGSKVVLYYGTDTTNRTPIFTGVIKDLPTYKPEKYQVELKLVSPLEMLKDIEAKDFSDKITGETLTYVENDNDGHKIYKTSQYGVGGFDAVYAGDTKLFEGVDYELDDLNDLQKPALVTIIKSEYYSATIKADYYVWKKSLTVEQIVEGLVSLAGYTSANEDIRAVAWNSIVRNPPASSPVFAALGYYESDINEYTFNWGGSQGTFDYTRLTGWTGASRRNILPSNWDYSFKIHIHTTTLHYGTGSVSLGDSHSSTEISYQYSGSTINLGECGVKNGFSVRFTKFSEEGGIGSSNKRHILVYQITNSSATLIHDEDVTSSTGSGGPSVNLKIQKRGNTVNIFYGSTQICSFTESRSLPYQRYYYTTDDYLTVENQKWNIYNSSLQNIGVNLSKPCIITETLDMTAMGNYWGAISAELSEIENTSYFLTVFFSSDGVNWGAGQAANMNTVLADTNRYLYYILGIDNAPGNSFNITNPTTYYYALNLLVNLVNLTGLTVLEALQDLALISGYEFGVDRQGVFFFRPRLQSTTPVYELDHEELLKVDTVKKNFNDFFTKLTLTFAEVPLEFYANTGDRPTLVDKYGIINKEIDKPDIVNYDNPELAQAIGPQLLEVYSAFPNSIQAVGKLNLALELGDIINLKRNYNLITEENSTNYFKYLSQQTFYRACKITGMNYNFDRKQITYTLRDVSNDNNEPGAEFYSYVYEYPIQYGVEE